MRMNIFSCLFVFVLGCNVTAEISHQVLEEKTSVYLRCTQSVEGVVMWSRERTGLRVDLLTVDGDREIRHNGTDKRFGSQVDKTLHISRVFVSDTGRYFCNDEPAVDLTVIPSGTYRLNVSGRGSANLTCRPDVGGSDVPSWRKEAGEIDKGRVRRVNKMLTIRDVRPDDSGLYYCDGKAAVYLNVTKDQVTEPGTTATTTTTRPTTTTTTRRKTAATSKKPKKPKGNGKKTKTTTTTTTTSTQRPTTGEPKSSLALWIGIVVPLLLLIIIIIIVVTLRRRFKRQGTEERGNVYDEIQDGAVTQPTNARPNLEDNTYSTICHIPMMENRTDAHRPNESPYSLIDDTFTAGNNKGPSQSTDSSVYFLLQKPKTP